MKRINYHLTDEDVETIIFCLKIIPFVNFDDVSPAQQSINTRLSLAAIEKLHNKCFDFSANEFRIMVVAIELAYLIIKNDCPYEISEGADINLTPYIFSINKLESNFCSLL